MEIRLRTWAKNHGSVSVNRGPLTYSLASGEQYVRTGGTDRWPAWEIRPSTPWNYGLVLDPDGPSSSFQVAERAWPQTDMPFTFDGVPIALKAKARRIPEWQLDRFGLVATLQDSPVKSDQPTETVTLIPMGAARLRISAFPAIGNGPDAHTWADTAAPKPLFHVSASHCNDLRGSTQARMVSRSGSDRGDDSLRVRGIEVEAPQERQDFVTLRGENLVVMDCHERNHV